MLKPRRKKHQRSYNITEGNGNHTEGIQHGSSQISPNNGVGGDGQ
jgi:hypothetical protein